MPRYGDEDIEQAIMLATVRTSRKHRKCATCDGEISPGEQYRRLFFPPGGDGAPGTYTVHLNAQDCWQVFQQEAKQEYLRELRFRQHAMWGQVVLNPEFLPPGGVL